MFEICLTLEVRGTSLMKRKELIFHVEHLLGSVNRVDTVRNIPEIGRYVSRLKGLDLTEKFLRQECFSSFQV